MSTSTRYLFAGVTCLGAFALMVHALVSAPVTAGLVFASAAVAFAIGALAYCTKA